MNIPTPTHSFLFILTKKKVYISLNSPAHYYNASSLDAYLFDGKPAEKTFKSNWFALDAYPKVVEYKTCGARRSVEYKLRPGFAPSEKMPARLELTYSWERDENDDINDPIYSLYDLITEQTADKIEVVTFEAKILADKSGNWEPLPNKHGAAHEILDEIATHPELLQDTPCKLTEGQTYFIIRDHIKTNINPRAAHVTSDYDFCLTVRKYVKLLSPVQYKANVASFYAKKPKYVTKERLMDEFEIFQCAPKAYQSYTVVTPFEGKNYTDLEKNIKVYLDDLMATINEELCVCDKCNGRGMVSDKK